MPSPIPLHIVQNLYIYFVQHSLVIPIATFKLDYYNVTVANQRIKNTKSLKLHSTISSPSTQQYIATIYRFDTADKRENAINFILPTDFETHVLEI